VPGKRQLPGLRLMLDTTKTRIVGACLGLAGMALLLLSVAGLPRRGEPLPADEQPPNGPPARAPEIASRPGERTAPAASDRRLDQQSVNDVVQRILHNVERSLSEGGHRAVLGIVAGPDDGRGVHVSGVTPDGPAHVAGIRSGDLLLEIDGVALTRTHDVSPVDSLLALLRRTDPGASVSVHYRRNEHDRYTDIELGDLADLPVLEPRGREPHSLWQDLELVALTPSLGRHFGTPEGWLVVRVPIEAGVDLREGDVVLAIDGREPRSPEHAARILASYQAGEPLEIEVMRDLGRTVLRTSGVDEAAQLAGIAHRTGRGAVGGEGASVPADRTPPA
jgi:S1-C subfamily serine protease